MKIEYRIRKHHGKWSIDQYMNGQFVCQIAYWFKSPGAARRQLNEMIQDQK